jgi:multidrug efflux pump subunit AcrA (membrane-fusion protein)
MKTRAAHDTLSIGLRAALSDGGWTSMLEERQSTGRDILDLPDTLYETDAPDADFDLGPKRSWLRRRWPLLVGLALVIVLAALILPRLLQPKPTPVTYQTASVRQGTLAVTVSATGPVTAPTYDANFAQQGTIYSIHVHVGQHVNSGDVLAKITVTDGIIYELDAPHAGTVAVINGNADGTPANGTGTSAFIELVDLSALHVEADVNEVDIGSVKPGQAVTFTVSAYANRIFRGTVGTISPAGTSSNNVVTYPVTINVNSSSLNGAQLLPTMTANVTITTASAQNALIIPASAVTYARTATVVSADARRQALLQAAQMAGFTGGTGTRGTPAAVGTNGKTPGIVLEQVQGKWVVKPVVLGLTNGTDYAVLAGLSQGESVVTGQSGSSTSNTTTNGNNGQGGNGFGPGGGGQFIIPGGGGGGRNGGNGGTNSQSSGR